MKDQREDLFPGIRHTIELLDPGNLTTKRKDVLKPLVDFLQSKLDSGSPIRLQFICTHNSRRSQFAQVWAQTLLSTYGIDAICLSGGTETTELNQRVVNTLQGSGFRVKLETSGENPQYSIHFSESHPPVKAYSKIFDSPENDPGKPFAALMTCSEAEDNCPFIPGTEVRLPLNYLDPKEYDGTALEIEKYSERSLQIATELLYVVQQLKKAP